MEPRASNLVQPQTAEQRGQVRDLLKRYITHVVNAYGTSALEYPDVSGLLTEEDLTVLRELESEIAAEPKRKKPEIEPAN